MPQWQVPLPQLDEVYLETIQEKWLPQQRKDQEVKFPRHLIDFFDHPLLNPTIELTKRKEGR